MITPTIVPSKAPAAFQRYPISLHRGQWPNIQSRHAQNEEEEAAALEAGWSTVCPRIPDPEEEAPAIPLEDRVAALEDGHANLRAQLIQLSASMRLRDAHKGKN